MYNSSINYLLDYNLFFVKINMNEKLFSLSYTDNDFFSKKISNNFFLKKIIVHCNMKKTNLHKLSFFSSLIIMNQLVGSNCILTKSKEAIASFDLKRNQILGFYSTLNFINSFNILFLLIHTSYIRSSDFFGFFNDSNDYDSFFFMLKDLYSLIDIDYDFQKWYRFYNQYASAFSFFLNFNANTNILFLSFFSQYEIHFF